MKYKSILSFTVLALSLCAGNSKAAVSVVSNSLAGGKNVVSSMGSALPAGSVVRVGFIENAAGNDAILRGGNFAALDAIFTPLGTENMDAGSGTGAYAIGTPTPGNWAGTINGIENSYAPVGTRLYLWVFNSATPSTATEWGLFTDATWVIPDGSIVAGSVSVTPSAVNDNSEVFRGTNNGATLGTAPIPEPSSVLMAVAGLLALSSRRRR